MLRATLVLVALAACSPGAPPSTASPPAEREPPAAEADAVLAKICAAAPCVGPLGRVEVLREDGKIVGYQHLGDLGRCSHPPAVYFDAAGQELGAIPEEPVAPGSEEARHFEAERLRLSRGGTKAETLRCPAT